MTDARLRAGLGLFWVAAQMMTIATILWCYWQGGFLFDQMTTLMAVVIPMFAGVSTVVVKYFAKHRHGLGRGRHVSFPYITLTVTFPVAFTAIVLWVVIGRASNSLFENFEQAKLFLAGLETLFVAYIAILLGPLFDASTTELRPTRKADVSGEDDGAQS